MRDLSGRADLLALNTATLGHNLDGYGAGWSPERIIDACAARDFGGVVFWRREIGGRAAEIGERVRAAGMEVTGLCRTPFFVGPTAPRSEALWDDLRASVDMAAALGARVLTIVTGGVDPGSTMAETLKRVADITSEAASFAKERNVDLALEPLNPVYGGDRSCLVSMRDAVAVCEAVDATNVGVAVDVYHVWWDLHLGEALQRAGKGRILGYHLCDWLAETRDVLLDRGMMGDGVADLKSLRDVVEGAGYDGVCEVEIFSANNWWKRDPGEVLDVIAERFQTIC